MARRLAGLDAAGNLNGASKQQQLFGECGLASIGVRNDGKGAPSGDFLGNCRHRPAILPFAAPGRQRAGRSVEPPRGRRRRRLSYHANMNSRNPSSAQLTHVNAAGEAHMVDVGGKAVTTRSAAAEARVVLGETAFTAIRDATAAKGDALGTARIAGI